MLSLQHPVARRGKKGVAGADSIGQQVNHFLFEAEKRAARPDIATLLAVRGGVQTGCVVKGVGCLLTLGSWSCGNGRQLQAQNQEMIYLTQKRLFPLFPKRLTSDQKRLFEPQRSLLSHFGVRKFFLVTFESLCRKRRKGEKVSLFSLFWVR